MQKLEQSFQQSVELLDRVNELDRFVCPLHFFPVYSVLLYLRRELHAVFYIATQIQAHRTWLGRWWTSSQDAATLRNLLRKIDAAKEKFQVREFSPTMT